jgi:hypothetical protein
MNYLERYRRGECEAVWEELQAQGTAVFAEPLRTDAQAVAQETMRRVRVNVEILIPRLQTLGYQFDNLGSEASQCAIPLLPPPPDIVARLNGLEADIGGPLPLSIRTAFEVVGKVDLCGEFPTDFPTLTPPVLDPLMIPSFEEALKDWRAEEGIPRSYRTLCMMPDALTKSGYSGVGDLEMTIPARTMDANLWLEAPYYHESLMFIRTLRRAFSHGGFCQLGGEDGTGDDIRNALTSNRAPNGETFLEFLTRGLLPI